MMRKETQKIMKQRKLRRDIYPVKSTCKFIFETVRVKIEKNLNWRTNVCKY